MRIPDAPDTGMEDGSVTGYQYRRSVGAGSYGSPTNIADLDLVVSGTGDEIRSYTVSRLNNGTEYRFQVRGRNSVGDAAWSEDEVAATPMAGTPGAPRNLSATAGDKQVTLSWTAPSDNGGESITRYEYVHREESENIYPADWTSTGGTGTTVTVHGLDNGTTYYFKVRAVNRLMSGGQEEDGLGLESREVFAKPFGKPVTEVDLAVPVSDKDGWVELIWTPNPAEHAPVRRRR